MALSTSTVSPKLRGLYTRKLRNETSLQTPEQLAHLLGKRALGTIEDVDLFMKATKPHQLDYTAYLQSLGRTFGIPPKDSASASNIMAIIWSLLLPQTPSRAYQEFKSTTTN
jgi:hypothetical protein